MLSAEVSPPAALEPVGSRAPPRLILITDAHRVGEGEALRCFQALCRAARPGTVMVQLRDRELAVRERLELGARLLEMVRREQQWLVVNDRLDLALSLHADGAHLGEHGVDPRDARRMVGQAWLSRACHRISELSQIADTAEVDAVLLSPVVTARKGREALGLSGLGAALAQIGGRRLWLYALGGVTTHTAAECVARGATGVAVMGAALKPDALELLDALGCRR